MPLRSGSAAWTLTEVPVGNLAPEGAGGPRVSFSFLFINCRKPSCRAPPRPPHEHRVDLADGEELAMFSAFEGFGVKKDGFS